MPESSVTTFDVMGRNVFQRNPLFAGVVDQRSVPPVATPAPASASAPDMQQALLSAVTARYAQGRLANLPLPTSKSPLTLLMRR